MNRKQTKKAIDVMHAYVDGAEIEYRNQHSDRWYQLSDSGILSWDWSTHKYRIKSKPREFWINPETDQRTTGLVEANQYPIQPFPSWIKVREVIE